MSRAVTDTWLVHAEEGGRLDRAGEDSKWGAKDEYETAWADGASERQIAEVAGFSDSHIHFMLTLVSKTQAEAEGWSFAEAYALAKKPRREGSDKEPGPLPDGTFRTIVADPPWQYDNKATRGAAEDHYDTLALDAICALSVPAAPDAHLYLWVTNGFLRQGFEVMDAWDFTYKACLTWIKRQMGTGNYFRNATEHVLFGLRGNLKTQAADIKTWFEAGRGRHSAKPDVFRTIVEQASPGPYLEMFARPGLARYDEWTYWGNEA